MSVTIAPYIMERRINFNYRLPEILDENGIFNGNVAAVLEIINDNSYRRSDELELKEWLEGRNAPINTRVLKKGNTVVTNKINNKIQHNYLKRLTRIRTGYLGGQPVKHTLDSDFYETDAALNQAHFAMSGFIKRTNLSDINSENIADCTLYGQSGRLMYIDNSPLSGDDRPVIMTMYVSGPDCLFIASNQWWLPEVSIRYVDDNTGTIELYDKKFIHVIFDGVLVSSTEHFIGMNPLIPYYNNKNKSGNMEDCLSKINDIDEQRSNLSSLLTSQRLVLKIFKDVDIDADTVEKTEQMGYIKLKTNEAGQGDVYFETLNIDAGATEKHIEELDRAVYLDSGIINLDDKKFGNESGEAKKYYLISMEANCVDTEAKFRASDYVMWAIVSRFYKAINIQIELDSIVSEWQRNLPNAITDEVAAFAQVFGKIPNETAYALLSFIKNPQQSAQEYNDSSSPSNV